MRHKWDHENQQRLMGDAFSDGCERNIRRCVFCGMEKITVIPPRQGDAVWPWREWRMPGDKPWRSEMTPVCAGKRPGKKQKIREVIENDRR